MTKRDDEEEIYMSSRYPLLSFRYTVEIDGLVVAGFSEVSGLEQELEIEEYKEGGMGFTHKLPNGVKHANLILKRGLSESRSLRAWYHSVVQAITYGKPLYKSPAIFVCIMDSQGQESVRFHVKQAYPIKWVGPSLNATGSEVATESVEIVHEGLSIV